MCKCRRIAAHAAIFGTENVIPLNSGISITLKDTGIRQYDEPIAASLRRTYKTSKHMKQPAVYIMTNKPDGVLYTGVTSNLVQRIWQHKEGEIAGFTKKYGLKTLVWYELHETMESAITKEKQIKNWKREWKINVITEKNPQWLDLWNSIVG